MAANPNRRHAKDKSHALTVIIGMGKGNKPYGLKYTIKEHNPPAPLNGLTPP